MLATLSFPTVRLTISMGIARLLGATAIGATAAPHHILCLHGGGTNAAIMRLQTSKLRHQLRDVAGMPDIGLEPRTSRAHVVCYSHA